jgi:hypothetical protein
MIAVLEGQQPLCFAGDPTTSIGLFLVGRQTGRKGREEFLRYR